MGPQVQQISIKNQMTKMGKAFPRNKNYMNKSFEFSVKTFFGLVFTIIWQKKYMKFRVKIFCFLHQN